MSGNSILLRCKSCGMLNRAPLQKISARPICGKCKQALDVPRHSVNVTEAAFDREVRDWPEVLLVEFRAKWCGYCRMIEHFIEELAAKYAGRLKIVKVDVDTDPALAARFRIKATPTFVLYRNAVQLGRIDGAPRENRELEGWIEQAMMRGSS